MRNVQVIHKLREGRKLISAEGALERFARLITVEKRGSLRLCHCLSYPVAELKALNTAVKLTVPAVAVAETLKDKLKGGVC